MQLPQSWAGARATLVIAGITAFAWLVTWVLRIDVTSAAIWGGFIPVRVPGLAGDEWLAPVWLTPLTATFVHGGPFHLLFNLLVLLVCGRAVEPIVGRWGFISLYVIGAYAAAAAQYAVEPGSEIPMIGASGAISAVLGAYALLFGRNKVKVANVRLAILINALWLAAAWVGLQILVGFTFRSLGTNIAIAAHIGGFLAGLLLSKPLLLLRWRGA